jgi:spore coat protein A
MASRRDFLKMAALAGTGVGLANCGAGGSAPVADNAGLSMRAFPFAQSPILRKFLLPLPNLPTANPNTTIYAGTDYYRLAAVQFQQQMHPDLPNPTRLWGYMDLTTGRAAYVGPTIMATRNRPVVLQVTNMLPSQHLLPVDATLMGANGAQNRIAVHLHGGFSPWTMDGNPYSWFTPTGSVGATDGSAGMSFLNGVTGSPGTAQYYYPNQQSARLLWFHDHALGTTRLNAYAGLAAAYLITDNVVNSLTSGSSPLVPPLSFTTPLVLQEKSFKAVSDPWGQPGDLWYASMYQVNVYPPAPFSNSAPLPGPGRWDQGPPANGFTASGPLPEPSCVPEFFGDTPVLNGMAYPYLEVQPRRYRFVVLNASQSRFFNLSLFYENPLAAGEADMTNSGPEFLQIGNEGGLLPAPVVLNAPPKLLALDPSDPSGNTVLVGASDPRNLLLGPAERADFIVDFSSCQPGDRLILYNDAPAPFPDGDSRNKYYTGDVDQSSIGGAPPTKLGQGPNTCTLMQFRVVALQGAADPLNFASTLSALSNPSGLPAAYANSHIPFGESDLSSANATVHRNLTLNEDFDGYGRLIQRLGTDTKIPGISDSYGRAYSDSATEVANTGATELWDIYNNTGDTHPIHFHLVNVQVIGRTAFAAVGDHFASPDSAFAAPDANEHGWKETVRMNPGEVTRVIMKFALPSVSFSVPASPRTGGNDYVWHCHILEHEEHDMMRPLIVL